MTHELADVNLPDAARDRWLSAWRLPSLALSFLPDDCRFGPTCRCPANGPKSSDRAGPAGDPSGDFAAAGEKSRRTCPSSRVLPKGMPDAADESRPPGLRRASLGPWPHDEYLEDGGDRYVQVNIGPGRRSARPGAGRHRGDLRHARRPHEIKPSNKVCLYSPRVSPPCGTVTNVIETATTISSIGCVPRRAASEPGRPLATTAVQPVRPKGEHQHATAEPRAHERARVAGHDQQASRSWASTAASPCYENLLVMQQGMFEESEKARLARGHRRGHRLDRTTRPCRSCSTAPRPSTSPASRQGPGHVPLRRAESSLLADHQDRLEEDGQARRDRRVHDSLRQPGRPAIKNVVLIDNLTTRLEYVPALPRAAAGPSSPPK